MEPGTRATAAAATERWDYVSPGLHDPGLAPLFPRMIPGRLEDNDWPYLRREVPHLWRVDARFPAMGFLSLDEATLLHALARPFAGRPALEIGCWRGWSTAHLAAAGLVLDVVDPVLADPTARDELKEIARATGAAERVTLHGLKSDEGVADTAVRRCRDWSFIFIDGDHEAPRPLLDALSVLPQAAADAMIVFHDLASPEVSMGLDALRERGWSTVVYQTMQVMGVAWRGDVRPAEHRPDPRVAWTLPRHLWSYPVCGEDEGERARRFERVLAAYPSLLGQGALARTAAERMLSGAASASASERLRSLETHARSDEAESEARLTLGELGRVAAELDRLSRDHASALQAVFRLCSERDDARADLTAAEAAARDARRDGEAAVQAARAEIGAVLQAARAKEEELAPLRRRIEELETALASASRRAEELAPYANRAGRTQAALLRALRGASASPAR